MSKTKLKPTIAKLAFPVVQFGGAVRSRPLRATPIMSATAVAAWTVAITAATATAPMVVRVPQVEAALLPAIIAAAVAVAVAKKSEIMSRKSKGHNLQFVT